MPVRMKHFLPRGLTRIRSHIPAADLRRLGTELLPPLPQQHPPGLHIVLLGAQSSATCRCGYFLPSPGVTGSA